MKAPPKIVAVGFLALVLVASLAIALPRDQVASLLDLTADRLPAPPESRILSPADREGVPGRVVLKAEASSAERPIVDVQYRVDAERWNSVPQAPRGTRSSSFTVEIDLAPGDHLLEVRAFDGETFGPAARTHVRRDAPTIHILEPADGKGVTPGKILVSGLVTGTPARAVVVEAAGATFPASLTFTGSWTAVVDMPPGHHTISARALAAVPSLPHEISLAAAQPAPPTLTILSPRNHSAYGATGDLACGGGCVVFSGIAPGAASVRVQVDGHGAGNVTPTAAGSWSYRLPMTALASGPHEARFQPVDAAGQEGVARQIVFTARTPLAIRIVGDAEARATGVPLAFSVEGERAEGTRWLLNGEPIGEGPAIALTLSRPGDHLLTAKAPGPEGRSGTAALALHAINRPPVTLGILHAGHEEGAAVLEVEAVDADGRIVETRWEFGDGTPNTTSTTLTALHRYEARGTFVVNATVVDDLGAVAAFSAPVVIENLAPHADFSWEPPLPTVLDVVRFEDLSRDYDGVVASRRWTFPDGNTTDAPAPALKFRTRGDHAVQLRVADETGLDVPVTKLVRVVNLPPQARAAFEPALPRSHDEILFSDASIDVDGPIVERRWDFGDGTTGTGLAVLHAYRAPGNYTVNLTVIDDVGAVALATLQVVVHDSAPAVSAVVVEPPHPRAKDQVTFRVVANDRDGDIAALTWDFGDGTGSHDGEPFHRYARSGHYQARVEVLDASGLSTVYPFTVVVDNALPQVSLSVLDRAYAAFPTELVANATDVDGRLVFYRFDADGDGRIDCEATTPSCRFVYEVPGTYAAHVFAEDDEAGIASDTILVDVLPPPSNLAPPRVVVESPAPASRVKGQHLFRGEATGVRPIDKIELQVRNETWAFSGGPEPWRLALGNASWTALVDTRGFPDGAFDLVVRVTDESGGMGFARVPILIENGPRPSDVSLRVLDAPEVLTGDAVVRASAYHPSGPVSVRWRVDEGAWTPLAGNPLAFDIDLDYDGLAPGPHVLRVEAYRSTHEMTNVTHTFQVPGVAPALVVDVPPPPVAYALVHAEGRVVGEGRVEYRIDNGFWTPAQPGASWNVTRETLDLPGGFHEFHLRAVSHDGRLASDVKTYRVQVLNPPIETREPAGPTPPPKLDVPLPSWLVLAGVVAASITFGRLSGRR